MLLPVAPPVPPEPPPAGLLPQSFENFGCARLSEPGKVSGSSWGESHEEDDEDIGAGEGDGEESGISEDS